MSTTAPLFVEERRRHILEQIRQQGRVFVKDLSDALNVSTVTIRQDLRALEDDGLLERTYGGAVQRASSAYNSPELSFDIRQSKSVGAKAAIGAAAAARVNRGDAIAMDCSTTSLAMVPHLKKIGKLTVVTNSLIIAQNFVDTPTIELLMPGGRLRRDSISLVGGENELPDINLNYGFFGARGITMANGITESDLDETEIKVAMRQRCINTIIIADGSKWGLVAPYTFAQPQEVTAIITSSDAAPELVADIRSTGATVEFVEG